MKSLNSEDIKTVKAKLHSNFKTWLSRELIFDGYFWVGNKQICNRLDSFVTSFQIETLRRFFKDELLIGRIIETLN